MKWSSKSDEFIDIFSLIASVTAGNPLCTSSVWKSIVYFFSSAARDTLFLLLGFYWIYSSLYPWHTVLPVPLRTTQLQSLIDPPHVWQLDQILSSNTPLLTVADTFSSKLVVPHGMFQACVDVLKSLMLNWWGGCIRGFLLMWLWRSYLWSWTVNRNSTVCQISLEVFFSQTRVLTFFF